MTLVDKLENTLKKVDPDPLYAVVGAADVVVEKIRAAGAEGSQVRVPRFPPDPRAASAKVQAAAARVEAVASNMRTRTAGADSVPDQAQILIADAVAQAITSYAEFASRGKNVVGRLRGQESATDSGASWPDEPAPNPGIEPGTESGTEPGIEPGIEPGTEQVTDADPDPGFDPGLDTRR